MYILNKDVIGIDNTNKLFRSGFAIEPNSEKFDWLLKNGHLTEVPNKEDVPLVKIKDKDKVITDGKE